MAATALQRPRLTGRPVIWDLEDVRPAAAGNPLIRERSTRLARALASRGVRAGHAVVVLCCHRHPEDRHVALTAIEGLGAVAIVPVDWTERGLRPVLSATSPGTVHLACEEGVEAWRAARGTGIMIGDGVGVLWWKGLECRHASDDGDSIDVAGGAGLRT